MKAYIICCYGIPKDIAADDNYRTYLHVTFNRIYAEAANGKAVIIVSGGPTSLEPPYEGTEAEIVAGYFEAFMRRPVVVEQTKTWTVQREDRSLSSLENLLFSKAILGEMGVTGGVTIFCEHTRIARVQKTGDCVFGSVTVVGVDFDVSKNRYLDPDIIARKEHEAEAEALWALEDAKRLQVHHEFFARKFAFFRKRRAEGASPVDIFEEWYKMAPECLREIVPDHPLLRDR